VDAEGLVDDALHVGKLLDHVKGGHVDARAGGNGLVELCLQLGQDAGRLDDPVENGARRVGGGVGAGNQLGQGLSGQFGPAELLAALVFALHEAREQIHAVHVLLALQALADARHRDASQVLHRCHALAEEGIREVFGVGFDLGQAPDGGRDLPSTIQHLDRGGVADGRLGRHPDLGDILPLFQHAERLPKREIANHVKCQVVEPVQAVELGKLPVGIVRQRVPLADEEVQVLVHVRLKLPDALGGEGMRNRLALPRVFGPVARVEETPLDRDKRIIKLPLLREPCSCL